MQTKGSQKEPYRFIGDRIRVARKVLGLTQDSLAKAIGVPKPSIARWETTPRHPGGEALVALAKALHVPLEWLVEGEGPPPERPEAQRNRIMRERRARMGQMLAGHGDLEAVAEKAGVNPDLLRDPYYEYAIIYLDEALRVAHVLGRSFSWLLYGDKQTPFAPDLEGAPEHFAKAPDPLLDLSTSAEQGITQGQMELIQQRRQRLAQLLRAQGDLKGLAAKTGIPERTLRGVVESKQSLGLDQIACITAATGLSLSWILFGEKPALDAQI